MKECCYLDVAHSYEDEDHSFEMVNYEELYLQTHSFGVNDYFYEEEINEVVQDFNPQDYINEDEIEVIDLLFENHLYGVKHPLCKEDVMEIGELQVLNTMEP